MNSTKTLKIAHWNCNSIFNKQTNFYCFLNLFKPDIVCLNETKLSETRANDEVFFKNHPSYYFFHKHRHQNINGAGGVAILIKKTDLFEFELCDIFDNFELELLSIRIKTNLKTFYLISYYNPPHNKISENLFELISDKSVLLLGDLNAKNFNLECENSNENSGLINTILSNFDLIPINNESPTHFNFSTKEENILDYAIVSPDIYDLIDNFQVLDDFNMGSDHYPLMVSLKVQYGTQPKTKNTLRTNWEIFLHPYRPHIQETIYQLKRKILL